MIAKILPVLDNFERALEPYGEDCEDALVKGMLMVYRQLSDAASSFRRQGDTGAGRGL